MNLLNTFTTAAAFFVLTLLVHIAICKFGSPKNFMLKGFMLGSFSATGCGIYMFYNRSFDFIGPYIVFSAWLFYLMILINLLNSVTLKMLACLYTAPTYGLNTQDFYHAFNTEDGFETRLAMLDSSQLIKLQGTTVTLTPKAQCFLAIVHRVKTVLSID